MEQEKSDQDEEENAFEEEIDRSNDLTFKKKEKKNNRGRKLTETNKYL
jgi:hypothetical protein